jgi:pimeloyl-ACP methyl ester carboxylesterase
MSNMSAGAIVVPTLYMWGNADQTVGRTAAEGTARYVRAPFEFVEIAGGGHFLTDDHPHEVNEALLRHLQAHRSATA